MEDFWQYFVVNAIIADSMKKKYLMVCFHHVHSAFDSNLTDEQKEEFFKKYPGLRWMEDLMYSEEEMDKQLNKLPVPAMEMWIEEITKFTAKYVGWVDRHIKGCRFI